MLHVRDRGFVFAIAMLMAIGPIAGPALATHDGGQPDAWTQQAKFTPADGRAGDSLALNAAGDTALVGAPDADGGNGAAFVFERDGSGGWTQAALIQAPTDDGLFAESVDLDASGDIALIGAEGERVAHVYTADSGGWSDGFSRTVLTPDGTTDNTEFGRQVALDDAGTTALVSDPGDNSQKAGEVFIFERTNEGWAQVFSLAATGVDSIGRALALDGDTAFVRSSQDIPTQVEVLERGENGWSNAQTLTGGNGFGKAIALDGDIALVGASTNLSEVLVYERIAGSWQQTATIDDGQETTTGSFGASIALDGDTALIGDPIATTSGGWRAGSAFVYEKVATGWERVDRLVTEDGVPGDDSPLNVEGDFASATALAGGTAWIGAPRTTVMDDGAAYVFTSGCSDDAGTVSGIVHDEAEPLVGDQVGDDARDTVHEQNCRWTQRLDG